MSTNFVDILKDVRGTGFFGIDTETPVLLRGGKANPMLGRVTKLVTGSNVMVFQNKFINGYSALVKRRLVAEGKMADDFKLGPRQWGERVPELPLIHHTKKGETQPCWYFEAIFVKAGDVQYLLDGQPIDKDKIQGMPDKPEEGEQGGLDNKVIIRSYSLDSIRTVRANHAVYNGPFHVQL